MHDEHKGKSEEIIEPSVCFDRIVPRGERGHLRVFEQDHRNEREYADGKHRIGNLTQVICIAGKTKLDLFVEEPVAPEYIKEEKGEARYHEIAPADQPATLKKEGPVHI